MNDNFKLDYILREQSFHIEDESYIVDDNLYVVNDELCPLSDDRTWKSNVEDIDGGDNFANFCEDYFRLLEEEGYFED